MNVDIREPHSEEEFRQYYDLRRRILREPWTNRAGSERDEHEGEAIHLGAWIEGRLMAVGRVHFTTDEEAQIRYMAVEEGFQGQGIGGLVLNELERRAKDAGARRIVLNAREKAMEFYRKHGYQVTCRADTLFGAIDHWEMRKEL